MLKAAEQFPGSMPCCMWIHPKSFIRYKISKSQNNLYKMMAVLERDGLWLSAHKSDQKNEHKTVNFNLSHCEFTKTLKSWLSSLTGLV